MKVQDYTLKKYGALCKTIVECGFETSTVHECISAAELTPQTVIFRHDVDRNPDQALKVALLEHSYGINSTYYFRSKKGVFSKSIIREIAQLGHEIGYHYETLAECNGDYEQAIALFTKELSTFRKLCPITTISMHGRPLSKFDNRDLWEQYDFRDYGLIGECYLSIDYNKIMYLSDTGRTWHPRRYNVRDQVVGQELPELETTDDLIRFIQVEVDRPLCLLTHPNRWTDSVVNWSKEWLLDLGINQAKKMLIVLRR